MYRRSFERHAMPLSIRIRHNRHDERRATYGPAVVRTSCDAPFDPNPSQPSLRASRAGMYRRSFEHRAMPLSIRIRNNRHDERRARYVPAVVRACDAPFDPNPSRPSLRASRAGRVVRRSSRRSPRRVSRRGRAADSTSPENDALGALGEAPVTTVITLFESGGREVKYEHQTIKSTGFAGRCVATPIASA